MEPFPETLSLSFTETLYIQTVLTKSQLCLTGSGLVTISFKATPPVPTQSPPTSTSVRERAQRYPDKVSLGQSCTRTKLHSDNALLGQRLTRTKLHSDKALLGQRLKPYLTECIHQSDSESQLPHKVVHLLCTMTDKKIELTVLWGS